MPKKDDRATRTLYEAGFFEHPDSYITLDGHIVLRGCDKSRVRREVFKRFKNACVVCGTQLRDYAAAFSPMCGAWHHPKACSCVGCSELRCDTSTGRKCHAHRTVGFERVASQNNWNRPGDMDSHLAFAPPTHMLKKPSRKLIAKRKKRAEKQFWAAITG